MTTAILQYICILNSGLKAAKLVFQMSTALKASRVSYISDFKEVTKYRLAMSVVFSSLAGYLLAVDTIVLSEIAILAFGGYCMVGASNAYNQIIEKDLDLLMKRTVNRPLPSKRMSVNTAFTIAVILTLLGVASLYTLNPKTAMFGAISIFLYACVYTPLKTKTPLAVFVGAIPGAIPFMLGWVAATGEFGIESGVLFMIQFFWQFPHFWAIGWFLHDDYQSAGFKMLPTGEKDKATLRQILIYSFWTLLCSLIPVVGKTGSLEITIPTAVVVGLLGVFLIKKALDLYKDRSASTARSLMLTSVLYITVLQVVYVVDKYIRLWMSL